MMNAQPAGGNHYALLIGIDGYQTSPLSGCVNDVERMAAILTSRLDVPAHHIQKLTAPRGMASSETADLPTRSKILGALNNLTNIVAPGDSVFIYYAGHGTTQQISDAESYVSGLVPLDHEAAGLLFEFELSEAFASIASRRADLSVIFDCGFSAGSTRSLGDPRHQESTRFMQVAGRASAEVAQALEQRMLRAAKAPAESSEYSSVAACHADEKAIECILPDRSGAVHGLFSACLFELLDQAASTDDLRGLRWCDIWEALKARMAQSTPDQRPLLLGRPDRRIFGGSSLPQEPGYAVTRSPDGSYAVAAGALAGMGRGARIAVYSPTLSQLPPPNSAEDRAVRLGVLVIKSVSAASSRAEPSPDAPPFEIPPAARGRLIEQGEPDSLRVSVQSNIDPVILAFLDRDLLRGKFVLLPANDPTCEVQVGQYPNGDLWIGDDLNGPGAPWEPTSPGPIGVVRRKNAPDAQDVANALRVGLNHYAQYVIPLRVYRSGGISLPADAVAVRLLDARNVEDYHRWGSDRALQREVPRDAGGRYRLQREDSFVFHVENRLSMDLCIFVLVCTSEGQIQLVDGDVLLRSRSSKIFWFQGMTGEPFQFELSDDRSWGIERLIVMATDQRGVDLQMLAQYETLDEAIRGSIGLRQVRELFTEKNVRMIRWTASQTLIQLGGPE